MKQLSLALSAALAVAAGSSVARADCYKDAGHYTCRDVKVTTLLADHTAKMLYVDTSGAETNVLGNTGGTACNNGSLRISMTDPAYNSMLSVLTAAQLSQRTVVLRMESGTTTCKIAYVILF
jgi:hypothetical protein